MSSHEDVSEVSEGVPAPIRRNSSVAGFTKLCKRRGRCDAFRKSRSRCSQPSDRSKNYESEDSQILYMAPKRKTRGRNRSLSCISNGPGRKMDGSSDAKTDLRDDELDQYASLNIIDREIFEWQYVCQTGRPYWWSPEAKYHRVKKVQPRITTEAGPRIWYREVDERTKPAYGVQRRAITDSFLSDPSTVHDLAHLIAIQLLSACFTLPADSTVGLPSPCYTSLDKRGSTRFPDPRMISSLRMHTNFRYSPSFGHQPRNSSPVQLWPGLYGGPSPISSPPTTNTDAATPDIGRSADPPKRSKYRRALHPTEDSGSGDSDLGMFSPCCSEANLDPTVGKTAWFRRQGVHDANCKVVTVPRLPRTFQDYKGGTRQSLDPNRALKTSQRQAKMNYCLQPTIKSEPHHVFIQPVKELVVKRWRSLTRKFGGSLHSALPGSQSDYPTSGSESGASEASAPVLSTDAKKRRQRAQERGDIHSSSVESTPHFNSPTSEMLSPPEPSGIVSPFSIESPAAPPSSPADTISKPASKARANRRSFTESRKAAIKAASASDPMIFARSHTSPTCSAPAGGFSNHSKLDSPLSSPSKVTSPASSYSYSSKRTARKHGRRSMLSEVCTPEDFQPPSGTNKYAERSILSAVGSTLTTPTEDPSMNLNAQSQKHANEDVFAGSLVAGFADKTDGGIKQRERPGFSRTSTSGTQIFTPEADGMELDGLPVGPDRSHWKGKGRRRERTYL
ncbi:hypothetical protein NA56DRAFT_208277 [Hyaloscypha hepaticicola]|uniref:Uncharacterized protein n=1 Tax=Hyaloscypha hepaticicola TaxID=2082293 RepID=A0A2J6PZ56_9HELO|nr:hypothetical protein NA56DRAFT_208277 [Hyaloscypha hepaticicola]